jgi:purine-binding chemotaxis protein CheW
MSATGTRQSRELLVFLIDEQRFALWADDVRELLRAVAVVPLPQAPPIIEGVIDLRGRVVPVLDLRRRFGLAPKEVEPSDHLIVADVPTDGAWRRVAIRADRALELTRLAFDRLELASALTSHAGYVAGVARLPDGLAIIHDLRTFLSAAEATCLDRAMETAEPGAHA